MITPFLACEVPTLTLTAREQPIGSFLADFTLPTLAGAPRSLSLLMRGCRGAVVVFWSGICSHCRRYDGYLNQWSQREVDLALVLVASRQEETADKLRQTLVERDLHVMVLHDTDRTVARAWFVEQTPRVFLLDSERRLYYRGAIDNFKYPQDPDYIAYLDPAIEAFLGGRSLPRSDTPSFGCPIASVYYNLPRL
jgi:thiol-disulfide isomerase/thioredoxin